MTFALRDGHDLFSQDHIPDFFEQVPLTALKEATRHEMSLHLNGDLPLSNNWTILADHIGCRMIEIANFERKDNPTAAVLTYAIQREINLKQLLEYILEMQRLDLIRECADMINRDAISYIERPIQVGEVSSGFQHLTFGDHETGQKEYFDAFVSYHPQDIAFVERLLQRLEDEERFKLCIPDRDVIIGIGSNTGTAELIERRCKRIIIVLSNCYVMSQQDNMLRWELNLALSLAAAGIGINKIIPIVIEEGVTIPTVLGPFAVANFCHYTTLTTKQWFWDRISRSLRAPTFNQGGYEGPDVPLRRIPFAQNDSANSNVRTSQPLGNTASSSFGVVNNRSQTEDQRPSSRMGDFEMATIMREDRE